MAKDPWDKRQVVAGNGGDAEPAIKAGRVVFYRGDGAWFEVEMEANGNLQVRGNTMSRIGPELSIHPKVSNVVSISMLH